MSFENDLASFRDVYNDNFLKVRRASALQMFGLVVRITPTDKGTLRNNWFVGIKKPERKITARSATSPNLIIAKIKNDLSKPTNLGDPIYLSNNLPYAFPIEMGWSRQARGGMIAPNLQYWDAIVQAQSKRLNL